MKPQWRLLPLSKPADPIWNMACDEMLLAMQRTPCLRFYQWKGEAISIGYFQDVEIFQQKYAYSMPVVKRVTGGGAVHHGRDLTMSLVMPIENPYLARKAQDSYRDLHRVILEELKQDFPELKWAENKQGLKPRAQSICFEEPVCYDLCLNGKKVLGSSQRRRHGNLLHQTSMRFPLVQEELVKRIQCAFENGFGITFENAPLNAEEQARVQMLAETRRKQALGSSLLTT